MPEERRLAAIMFTDMVGYTALMGRDEALAHDLVQRSRAHVRSLVEQFHGQWLEEVGDATLSAFPSAVEAVQCALAIQSSLGEDPDLTLRIGIHLGDVVFDGGRIYGDGVNVASRLEPLAEPGGIAVSEPVRQAVRGQGRVRATYLGRKRLKNVDEPVLVFTLAAADAPDGRAGRIWQRLAARRVPQAMMLYGLLVALLVAAAWVLVPRLGAAPEWIDAMLVGLVALTPAVALLTYRHTSRQRDDPALLERLALPLNLLAALGLVVIMMRDLPWGDATVPEASIAVLPLVNLGSDDDGRYFSDGLTEELINALAGVEGLNVASRTASFSVGREGRDVAEIARDMGVRHLLEGSVRREGNDVRIGVQLIDSRTGYQLWREQYERTLDDIFAVQAEIARGVAGELGVIVSGHQVLARRPTDNIQAYDFYLQGLAYLRRPPELVSLDAADQLFRRTLELDPDFARAHAGLCEADLMRFRLTNSPQYLDSGETSCLRALELDGTLTEVRVALGNLYRETGRAEDAIRVFRNVVQEQPSTAEAWIGLGRTLADTGHDDEAEQALRRAVQLEPGNWSMHLALGQFLYWQNRFVEADSVFQHVMSLTPDNARALHNLGSTFLVMGRVDVATITLQRSLELTPSRQGYRNLGLAFYLQRDFQASLANMDRAIELGPEDHWSWGSRADALRHLGRDEQAAATYRRAAVLAGSLLQRNPGDASTQGVLGVYLARLGEIGAGRDAVREALDRDPAKPEVLWYAAEIELAAGNVEGALDHLEEALERGFSASYLSMDPDFAVLDGEPRFQAMLDDFSGPDAKT